MNQEQQSIFLTKCLLHAVAAAGASYSVAIVAALNAAMSLVAAQAGQDKVAAWATLDACTASMETGLIDQFGPRPDPSVN